jgi:hypothetical protein
MPREFLSCRRGGYSSAASSDVNSEEKLNEENYDEEFWNAKKISAESRAKFRLVKLQAA